MSSLDVVAPATGESLGSVTATGREELQTAAAVARRVQPLWAAVPVAARARFLRRAAQAVLDEVDSLAELMARETGRPRTEALLAELLPSVSGLHALADAAPGALGERRLGRRAARAAGRRAALLAAPVGVVGLRGGTASPWAEPLLETAAALAAGNAVLLVPTTGLTGDRITRVLARAGVPDGLVAVLHGATAASTLGAGRTVGTAADASRQDLAADTDGPCDAVFALDPRATKGTLLVLGGASQAAVVAGALWGAFAGGGDHPAAVGRVVVVPELADPLAAALADAAQRLRVGDPADPDTEIGAMPSADRLAAVEAAVAAAQAEGAVRLCGGPVEVAGLPGAFFAPAVLRGVRADSALVRDAPPGPVLAVVEAAAEAEAIALAGDGSAGAVSVWTGDRADGERIARTLPAELTWVNEHGHATPAAPVRLARHVRARQLASQPARLRSAHWLPYDPALVGGRVAVARLLYGRESQRWPALRHGAVPLARTAVRVVREARQG